MTASAPSVPEQSMVILNHIASSSTKNAARMIKLGAGEGLVKVCAAHRSTKNDALMPLVFGCLAEITPQCTCGV